LKLSTGCESGGKLFKCYTRNKIKKNMCMFTDNNEEGKINEFNTDLKLEIIKRLGVILDNERISPV